MRRLIVPLIFSICLFLSGCKKIQIFEGPPITEAVEVSDRELATETFYVKNGTRFSAVYKPLGNAKSESKGVKSSRVFYMMEDQAMIPVHYKDEIIAYASAKADLRTVNLERFKDMGYSLGIFGGEVKEDGYYHFSGKSNVAAGSEAAEIFSQLPSEEIRVVTIGDSDIKDFIDKESGIITGMNKGGVYKMEFYAGTYFYRHYFTADTQFLKSFEYYSYGSNKISDTVNGYMCFETPNDLKSGYYNINGTGLFLYHDYARGESVENEDLNVSYYKDLRDMYALYTKQYNLTLPQQTKDLKIVVDYDGVNDTNDRNAEVEGIVTGPDGTVFQMDDTGNQLSLSLQLAKAGDWTVNISPVSLNILDVRTESKEIQEDTVCAETEFTLESDDTYQMFYADVYGSGEVYGSIISSSGVTYNLAEYKYKGNNNEDQRALYYKMPYVKAGTYKVRIYYYKSTTDIKNIQMIPYEDDESSIIIVQ